MNEILKMLPVLACLMITNISLGIWNKIGIEQINFDIRKLIVGIVKAIIIAASTLSLAYTAQVVDLSPIGVTPELLVSTAIIVYAGKNAMHLATIFGIQKKFPTIDKKDDENISEDIKE